MKFLTQSWLQRHPVPELLTNNNSKKYIKYNAREAFKYKDVGNSS